MIKDEQKEFIERMCVQESEEVIHGEHLSNKLVMFWSSAEYKEPGTDEHVCIHWWMKQNGCVRTAVSLGQMSLTITLGYRRDIMYVCFKTKTSYPTALDWEIYLFHDDNHK